MRFAMSAPSVVVAAVCSALTFGAGCPDETPVLVYVDGFQPENVRFEIEALGPQTAEQLQKLKARPDINDALLLPTGSCGGPCKAALISISVKNPSTSAEPPPVVRLAVPPGKERRLPIAYGGENIDAGRTGRIRWLVEMYPEEKDLTVTLSPSVRFDVKEPVAPPASPPSASPPAPLPPSPLPGAPPAATGNVNK